MGLVVTGISQDGNIKQLEAALEKSGLPLDPIQLIGAGDSEANLTDDVRGGGGIDTSLMTGGGQGTGVPGLTGSGSGGNIGAGLGTGHRSYFRNETLSDRLGDLEIPDSEVENYVEALEAGRSVVAYFARPENLGKVEEDLLAPQAWQKSKLF